MRKKRERVEGLGKSLRFRKKLREKRERVEGKEGKS